MCDGLDSDREGGMGCGVAWSVSVVCVQSFGLTVGSLYISMNNEENSFCFPAA